MHAGTTDGAYLSANGLHEHLLKDIWELGWKVIDEMGVNAVREKVEARLARKKKYPSIS